MNLRGYQIRCVNQMLRFLRQGMNALLVAATGSGKTVMFCEAVRFLAAQGWWVLLVVHRQELMDQISRRLDALGIPHGLIAPGYPRTSHLVQIASINTLVARKDQLADYLAKVDLVVFDEAHHMVAGMWRTVIELLKKAVVLGATATPFRLDGQGIGEVGGFQAVVEAPSISELTAMGYLAPARIHAPPVAVDLRGVKKRGGDYAVGELQRLMDADEITRKTVGWYTRLSPGAACIVFCTGVEHAEHVAAAFTADGWVARSIDGGMDSDDRREAIEDLAAGRLQVLTSVQLLTEGVDVPLVETAIMLRPTQSTSLYLQMVGRALRPHERKSHALLLDMVGNVHAHGLPDAKRKWDLRGGLKGLERAVEGTRRCRRCYRVHRWAEACEGCGAAYPKIAGRADAAKGIAGAPGLAGFTADEIMLMNFKALMDIAKTEADLRTVAQIRGYKPAWVRNVMERRAVYQNRYRRAAE